MRLLIRGSLVQVQQGELGNQQFEKSRKRLFSFLSAICQRVMGEEFERAG